MREPKKNQLDLEIIFDVSFFSMLALFCLLAVGMVLCQETNRQLQTANLPSVPLHRIQTVSWISFSRVWQKNLYQV